MNEEAGSVESERQMELLGVRNNEQDGRAGKETENNRMPTIGNLPVCPNEELATRDEWNAV